MARRGENIFKRRDGRWEGRYIKGYELSGKIRYGYCYGRTYAEAREKVVKCKAALLNHTPLPAADRRRLAAFCAEWLELERGKVKESTFIKYETVLTRHILPGLGGCHPQAVSAETVERFTRELLKAGYAVKTVRDILAVLRAVLKYTAARCPGLCPPVDIRAPKEPRQDIRVLDPEEQRRFVAYLETDMDECRFGVLLALLTGLRIGELCALRWENVSLQNRTLRVDAAMQRLRDLSGAGKGKTRVVITSPKSASSVRTIPLTEHAAGLCAKFDPHCPAAFLLTGTERFMEPRLLQKRLARYTAACGLEGVHFHTIRHTFATRCVEAGFEIKSLSEILGHASTSITLNRYVHSSMELKRANMDKLAAVGM